MHLGLVHALLRDYPLLVLNKQQAGKGGILFDRLPLLAALYLIPLQFFRFRSR